MICACSVSDWLYYFAYLKANSDSILCSYIQCVKMCNYHIAMTENECVKTKTSLQIYTFWIMLVFVSRDSFLQ